MGDNLNGLISIKTDYSLLNSLVKVKDLLDFLKKNKYISCGIIDTNLSASMELISGCKELNIKPIVGLDIILDEKHLFLYAMNYDGYCNLLQVDLRKDSLNTDLLKEYSANILCVIPYHSVSLRELVSFYPEVYYGYQNNDEKVDLLRITKKVVYIKEVRCLKKEDNKYLKYLNMLGGTSKIDFNYEYTLSKDDLYGLKEVSDKINLEFPKNVRYIPRQGRNSEKFLIELANKGLNKRLNNKVTKEYQDRLNYELSVISKMGFVDYFLIVYDYCCYAKKNDIYVGPGRGSSAGSLVCYSIGINDIDPIKYNLMFERFLNIDRVTMPDIDIDFESSKRKDIIEYVRNKYGKNNVAVGITYNNLKTKSVLREVAKLIKLDEELLNKFLDSIDGKISLKENAENETVAKYIKMYPQINKLYDIAYKLEGIKKNTSINAAGLIISSVDLTKIIPVVKDEDENLITGIEMPYLESLGFLKMDFLAVKNLDIIANILRQTDKNLLKNIDLNDKNVIDMFNRADTDGIFQYETATMKKLLRKLKPQNFNDLIAAMALVRPGPAQDEFISNKENENNISYLHDSLKPILKETYGVILYQEQVILILEQLGGFSKNEADIIRRAISKKKDELIKVYKDKFILGAKKNGINPNISEQIYDLIERFAGYGFNKSHSVAYALVAYQMAYLKCYYPIYFINELLLDGKSTVEISSYINELKRKNIKVVKPDVNKSFKNFNIVDNSLILPLTIIKGITKNISDAIIDNAPYKDYFDFLSKNKDIKKNILETLIYAGSFDSLGLNKKTLINLYDSAMNYVSLDVDDDDLKPIINKYEEFDNSVLNDKEIELFGFYVSNHPASKYQSKNITKLKDVKSKLYKDIKIIVIIENIHKIKDKNGNDMAFLKVSDETGTMDVTVFAENFKMLENIRRNELVLIEGKPSKSLDKIRIILNSIIKSK